jgi:hypothetical protein
MKKLLFVCVCALVLGSSSPCNAAEDWGWRVAKTTVDIFIARPFTFAATAIGAAIWTATLPITLPTKTSWDAFDTMIAAPWGYTVDRPLGDFED